MNVYGLLLATTYDNKVCNVPVYWLGEPYIAFQDGFGKEIKLLLIPSLSIYKFLLGMPFKNTITSLSIKKSYGTSRVHLIPLPKKCMS